MRRSAREVRMGKERRAAGRERSDKGGKSEDRREKALGRLDTKRGDKPAGKFAAKPAGKFGAKGRSEDEGDDRRPRPARWHEPHGECLDGARARPTRDGKSASLPPARRPKACSRNHLRRMKPAATSCDMRMPKASGSAPTPRAKKKVAVDAATVRAAKRVLVIVVDAAESLLATVPFRDRPREDGDRRAVQRASATVRLAVTSPLATGRS